MESRDEGRSGTAGEIGTGNNDSRRPEEAQHSAAATAAASSSSNSYDYVIVGAGPSCAGLLHGFLTTTRADEPVLRIAVLERGPLQSAAAREELNSLLPPHQWFRAAHTTPPQPPTEHDDGPPPLLEGITTQGRKLTVPIGHGVDGTTRIHASLCVPPSQDDFQTWPEPFRTHLLPACQRVQATLHTNNALTPISIDVDDATASPPPSPSPSPSLQPVVDWNETTFPSRPNAIPMTVHRSSNVRDGPDSYQRSSYMEGLGLCFEMGGDQNHNNHHEPQHHHLLCRRTITHANATVEAIRGHAERLLFAAPSNAMPSRPANSTLAIVGVEYRPYGTEAPEKKDDHKETGAASGQPPPFQGHRTLYATRDVILCAGALETPALLLVSGLGGSNDHEHPPDHHGDDDAPPGLPVGRTLRDHAVLSRAVWKWRTGAVTTFDTTASVNGLTSLRQIQIDGSRFQVGVFDGRAYGDILPHVVAGWFHWHCSSSSSTGPWWWATLTNRASSAVHRIMRKTLTLLLHPRCSPLYWLLRHHVKAVSIFHLHPTSVGRVRIRPRAGTTEEGSLSSSLSSGRRPLRRSDVDLDVTLGYADTEADLRALRSGFIASQGLSECRGVELFPGPLVRPWTTPCLWRQTTTHPTVPSEARFRWFCHTTCLPYFHWCGSCRMIASDGKHPNGVVDAALRVRGYSGLRICDASVFPTTISAPTALTCAGLGYLLGATILPTAELAECKWVYSS